MKKAYLVITRRRTRELAGLSDKIGFHTFTNLAKAYRYVEKILDAANIEPDKSYGQVNRALKHEFFVMVGRAPGEESNFAIRIEEITINPEELS